ncbi:12145_t:CDS:2 [Dentiscutata erythropus]|uniref:12145_t:CDS:1 n=1 Tax=Dentiscutata erythropus TaxID=1348616 RepID=A0A9N9DPP9_9GLOM|nr:12145_t:CDS:2 [Dentiscutata erythropus]
MSDATSPPYINIVVSIGLAAVALNTIGSIYVIYRAFNRWIVTNRPLSMSFRVPMYIAITVLTSLIPINSLSISVTQSYTLSHGETFQGIACKVVGGLSFFGVSNNMSLVGSLALLTYFRTCQKWYIDLGKYDYKLFAIISLVSFMLTLIGVPSFGPSGYWCYTNQINPTTPIIVIILTFTIILITFFCYIATLREINIQQKAVRKLNTQSKLSRVEIIVTRKITGYILIFLLQWTPSIFYVIGQILGTINSETFTEQSDEWINNGNISPSRIKVHEVVTIETKEIL